MHRAMHRAMHCMKPSVTWRVTRRAARCWQAGAVCVLRSAAELVPETSRLGALWHGAAPPSQERREDILRAVNEVLLALSSNGTRPAIYSPNLSTIYARSCSRCSPPTPPTRAASCTRACAAASPRHCASCATPTLLEQG